MIAIRQLQHLITAQLDLALVRTCFLCNLFDSLVLVVISMCALVITVCIQPMTIRGGTALVRHLLLTALRFFICVDFLRIIQTLYCLNRLLCISRSKF